MLVKKQTNKKNHSPGGIPGIPGIMGGIIPPIGIMLRKTRSLSWRGNNIKVPLNYSCRQIKIRSHPGGIPGGMPCIIGGTPGIIGGIPVKLRHVVFVFYSKPQMLWGFLDFDARPWNDPALTLIPSGVHPMCASHGRNPHLGHWCCIARLGLNGHALLCRWARLVVVIVVLIRIILIWLFLLTLWNQIDKTSIHQVYLQKLKARFFCASRIPIDDLHTLLFQHTNLVISAPTFSACPACPSLESLPFHRSPARCLFFPELHLEHCQSSLCEPVRADFGIYINCPRHAGITKQHVNIRRWINEQERKATNLHAVNS